MMPDFKKNMASIGPEMFPQERKDESARKNPDFPASPLQGRPVACIYIPMDRGPSGPVIFFDGVCGLCNAFVDFVLARDRRATFRFATLQGETASGVLREGAAAREPSGHAGGGDSGEWMRSVVLRDRDGLHRKSEAALRILAGLGGPWRLLGLFRLVPRPLRDAAYDLIARNRYRWFGKRAACRMPAPEERGRFLP